MCYTIKIEQTREALEKRFGARFTEPEKYRPGRKVNAFTLPLLPVICSDNPENISLFYWGLIPRWVKNMDYAQDIRIKTFNARSESIAEKASFRHLYRRNHCLVLVDGFYEWQHNDKTKVAYLIGLKDQESFALAGLYDKGGESGIILTQASMALHVGSWAPYFVAIASNSMVVFVASIPLSFSSSTN